MVDRPAQLPAALLGLALVACQAVPPGAVSPKDPREGVQPPPAWQQAGGSAPLDDAFWEAFESPTLENLITEGLAANPSLAALALRVVRASAFLNGAEGASAPVVTASLQAARSRVNFVGLPIGGGGVLSSTSTSLGLGVDVAWELDLWGRLASAERGALANLEAAGHDLTGAERSLAGQIVKAAVTVAELEAARGVAEDALALAERIERNARRLLADGTGSGQALLAAGARVDGNKATIVQLLGARQAAETRLATLLGRPGGALEPGTAAALVAELLERPLPATPDAGVPADVLARRPDLAAAEARVRAAQASAEAAHAELYPRLSLMASAGTSGTELDDLVDGDFRVWSLGANVLQPLLNGGVLRAREDQAIADRDLALVDFALTFLTACSEVNTALQNERALADELALTRRQRDQLVRSAELLAEKHARGSASSTEVLVAQAEALAVETRLIALRRARLHNRIDLHLALGGGLPTPAQ